MFRLRKRRDVSTTRHEKFGKITAEIGRFTYGTERMTVRQWGEGAALKIGSFCSIAAGLKVMLGGNHRLDWITTFPFGHIHQDQLGGEGIVGHPRTNGDVVIGNDVWLGEDVTIMSGVSIGDGAVIAAQSTVVKTVGAYEVWGGNPATFIKRRFDDEIVADLLRLRWWDADLPSIRQIAPLLSKAPDREAIARIRSILGRDAPPTGM